MRRLALVAALCATLAACERGQVVRVSACALTDGKLSAAFAEPKKAVEYLRKLPARLRAREDAAIDETIDLIERTERCISSAR